MLAWSRTISTPHIASKPLTWDLWRLLRLRVACWICAIYARNPHNWVPLWYVLACVHVCDCVFVSTWHVCGACVCASLCACACACVRACVCACVCACVVSVFVLVIPLVICGIHWDCGLRANHLHLKGYVDRQFFMWDRQGVAALYWCFV